MIGDLAAQNGQISPINLKLRRKNHFPSTNINLSNHH
jgi:hypothetical protein